MTDYPDFRASMQQSWRDPPWRFQNRTGKVAPEHRRLKRYQTMTLDEICEMPICRHACDASHLYLWVPNALLEEGLRVMNAWGFRYKTNLIWYKVRKDGGPDGRGVGFYFRNVTELPIVLECGAACERSTRDARRSTCSPPASVNIPAKPSETYRIIEDCSPGPYLELFAREPVEGWDQWGDELETYHETRRVTAGYQGGDVD